ncbi:hypothetical protein LPJ78_004254 [Coemansia sp. RSA 989]|nr:WD40-repeat-containing domain protein [Coemansia mojavensis]KAJ1740306.1 hypothetical protein LPJ68_003894 [Coemansia sp. RSA 1086]KAJ1748935.1 hypothetical protein LPJ79_004120 [Coemansia sp. RSA 1821]KAJ1863128.1 hypothetical protein LPJ78_004254 [Coemansia sp. RSA 989]KAJ1871869.1 hypothetical protein LPJ55_003563 [Coemansia sp. RSA 990]KAJ2673763.1 hypothetical protein IWW42_002175 [Coemansia sp. RSA 1085]
MRREPQRPRKRPRASHDCRQASLDSLETSTSQTNTAPREIPGFVWDAEKRRYFPATSRAANSSERQHNERKRLNAERIAQAQRQHRNSNQPIPTLLRQRSSKWAQTVQPWWLQSQNTTTDSILYAYVSKTPRRVYSRDNAVVACLKSVENYRGKQWMAVGYSNGDLLTAELDKGSIAQHILHRAAGKVTSICALDDTVLYTSIGNESGSTYGLVKLDAPSLSATTIPRTTLFACSAINAATTFQALLGANKKIIKANCSQATMLDTFTLSTKTDIISTALADPNVGFGGGRDGHVRMIDSRVSSSRHHARRGLLAQTVCSNSSSIHGLAIDGSLLASASMDGQVNVWDIRMLPSSRRSTSVHFHKLSKPTTVTSASPLGFGLARGVVFGATPDNQIKLWGLRSGQCLRTLQLAASDSLCSALDVNCVIGRPPVVYVGKSDAVYAYDDR